MKYQQTDYFWLRAIRYMKKPNIILFITDQHKADHLGTYGNRIVKTPHLDMIAAKGWRSDRFYVASPICMPNRSSLMTGRMPSVHGARHNGIPLDLSSRTFVELLQEAGYETSLIGKSHLQNMSGKGPHWPRAIDAPTKGEARRTEKGNYDQEWGPFWQKDPNYDLDTPFYGFSRVNLAVDHGDQVWGHYWRWLEKNHPETAQLAGPEHAIPTPEYKLSQFNQAWRTRVPEELSTNAYIGLKAKEQIKEYTEAEQPFFLMCSFPDPHHPFTPHGKYWDMYDPDEVDLPPSFHASQTRPASTAVQWLYDQRDSNTALKNTPAVFSCTEREAREAIALNYGSITHIDTVIGEVMQQLEESGQADNTIIIFMSDHGDYLGDHQLLWKGPIHFQSVIRTPFIWYDPTMSHELKSSDVLASTIDVAPTILERVGITPYNGIQGMSLLEVMNQKEAKGRNHLVVEEEGQRIMFGLNSRVRMRTLVSNQYRLSVYEGSGWGELYDLENDPMELHNLWNNADYLLIKSQLLHELVETMIMNSETSPHPTALA